MAAVRLDPLVDDGSSVRHRHNENATTDQPPAITTIAVALVCSRLDFAGHCAGFAATRTRRATVLGAHDATRDSDADLGAATRPWTAVDCVSLGIAPSMARNRSEHRAFASFQENLGVRFSPAVGLDGVRACTLDLAYSFLV